jgi:putative glutamine amidotransferase
MKIAVTHCGNEKKQPVYMEWLSSFDPSVDLVTISAGQPETLFDDADGLVLTGGDDVDPLFSKAYPAHLVQSVDTRRDRFEFAILQRAFDRRLPVFGICRGMQVINVHLGGTLVADLHYDGFGKHETRSGEPEVWHQVAVDESTLLGTINGSALGSVNSYHHQAVKDLAPGLIVSSRSDDGVVESFEWKETQHRSFMLAVQWHPERMTDRTNPLTGAIAQTFFAAVKKV